MRIKVLGPVEVWNADRNLVGACRPAQLAVLGLLALHANQVVSRDRLIDWLWGERHPATAENLVQVHVSRLRSALRRGGREAAGRIATRTPGYVLHAEPGELDLLEFEQLARTGGTALSGGDPSEAARLLRGALDLWTGPALGGLGLSPRAQAGAMQLEERRLSVLEQRIEADLRCGGHCEVIGELRGLVADYPLRERLWEHLMVALCQAGRAGEALYAYTEARGHLVDQLGIEPGPSLRRLQDRILAGSSREGRPDQAESDDTAGRHPAADLADPRPMEGLASAQPVERSAAPRQLPFDIRGFIGRHEELAHLDRLQDDAGANPSAATVAVVSGTAGVGKTALAVRWAHSVQDRFPDGSLFVNLRGYDPVGPPMEPAEALDGFLRALGTAPAAIPPNLEERAALFRTRTSGRRILILLDNAASSEQVRWLLPGSSRCMVLVTSRGRLSGLTVREGADRLCLDLLAEKEALRLLRQDIGSRRADAEPDAAAELARLCACLPLALRLVAELTRTRKHTALADLARDLADQRRRLDLLATDDDQATAVRAVFSWSYDALTPAEARAFRLLSVHPGPDVGRGGAAALIGTDGPGARLLLDKLTGAHLLQETSHDRYRFHDLLRAYAVDRAHEDESVAEREEAESRVLHWYMHTALSADRVIMPLRRHIELGPPPAGVRPIELRNPTDAVAWCESERPNLVAAVHHSVESGRYEVAKKLPQILWSYFSVATRWSDWITTSRLGVRASQDDGDRFAEAFSRASLANAYRDIRRLDDAVEQFEQAIAISQEIGELWIEASARSVLGMTHRDRRQFDAALHNCRSGLRLFTAIDDEWGVAWSFYGLGDLLGACRDHDDAIAHLRKALAIFNRIDDQWGRSRALFGLGHNHYHLKQYDEAAIYCGEALTIAGKIGNRHGVALALYTLGRIESDTGNIDSARRTWRRALAIFEELDAPQAVAVRALVREDADSDAT
ncbi:BTAD domain-containing putative transcriptional regulator [Actinomadura sp. KC06]|uniref:AfsR/SARP family transcriptional regulator n=1 Tax=Actinomadura sp. KC06 TaxID=2530369 RepID=UPI0014053DD7|nr:BTAD domain-containing putative transcriptional regulator [Actinomadura sp. KC06]